MKTISDEQLKLIFKKVKHFHPPKNLEEIEFNDLVYFSWIDKTNQNFYLLADYKDKSEGIVWKISKISTLALAQGLCDICFTQRRRDELFTITTKTRKLPKELTYRSRTFYVCSDFQLCNNSLKDDVRLHRIRTSIIDS